MRLHRSRRRQGHADRKQLDKEVYNGDLGMIVSRIDPDAGEPAVDFDGREISYIFGELDNWYLPTPPRFTRAKGLSTPRWLSL